MTVMQAITVAGGQRRGADDAFATIRLISDLRSSNDQIVRLTAKIARLQAELDGAEKISFPNIPEIDSLGGSDEIFTRERILFEMQNEETERQVKSLTELRDLFSQEISVLEQKREASEMGVASAQRELEGVSKLVEKGFAIASRKSDMERMVMGFKSDTLDQTTAIMRARQGIAEATRNLDSLQDRRRSEAAKEMQDAKNAIQQEMFKRDTTQKLLVNSMSQPAQAGVDEPAVDLAIVRIVNGEATEIEATEMTMLQPGDVVNAKLKLSPGSPAQPDASKVGRDLSASQ
jgi:polysaccharide export outer membrane protein